MERGRGQNRSAVTNVSAYTVVGLRGQPEVIICGE